MPKHGRMNMDEEDESPNSAFDKSRGDKGVAPNFEGQKRVRDGQNINIPEDAQGFPIMIAKTRNNLTMAGEGNYVGPFKEVVGKQNLMKSNEGFENPNDEEEGVE